jgi:phosphatidylinositol 4-phosphatase
VDYIPQYAFNDSLLGELQGIEYAPFRVPCLFGYVYISSPNFSRATKVDFILISRKDCRRPGRRFVTRGLDREGNAANFVETEHIFVQYCQPKMKVASLV